jgi:hypothetical protein
MSVFGKRYNEQYSCGYSYLPAHAGILVIPFSPLQLNIVKTPIRHKYIFKNVQFQIRAVTGVAAASFLVVGY